MNDPAGSASQLRRPTGDARVWVAVAVLLGYIAVFYGIAQSSGIPYREWFANAGNATRSALIPLAVGSGFLFLCLGMLRWNAIWRDPVRLPTNRLHWILLLLFAGIILFRFVFIRWNEVPGDLLLVVFGVGVGVGFAEEMALRGFFLRGMRTDGRGEGRAVLLTCVAFGLLHIPNIFLGMGLMGLLQLVMAGLTGFILYLYRRRFAWIVPAMIAHGLWDISMFLSADYLSETMNYLSIALTFLMQILALVALIQFVRREQAPVSIPAITR